MQNIFLAGGGSAEDSKTLDEAFVASLPPRPRIAYIPVALRGSGRDYDSCLAWLRGALDPLGVGEIALWTELASRTLGELQQFDALYIGGGNTYSLLKDVRESGFDAVLTAYAGLGGTIYGGSAGAIILGAGIGPCAHLDQNEVGLTDLRGLNLIGGGVSVWCHYTPRDDARATRCAAQSDGDVIAITEQGGLHARETSLAVIGHDAVRFRKASKSIAPVGTRIGISL